MTMIEAGTRVKKGYYFSGQSWMLQPVAVDGEVLAGAKGEKFLAVPLPLAFALAPMLGAAFLMFLPVIGFYLVGQAVVKPVTGLFRKSATEVAATMAPAWVPGEAHLTGEGTKQEEGKVEEGAGAAKDEKLAELEKQIEAKRDASR